MAVKTLWADVASCLRLRRLEAALAFWKEVGLVKKDMMDIGVMRKVPDPGGGKRRGGGGRVCRDDASRGVGDLRGLDSRQVKVKYSKKQVCSLGGGSLDLSEATIEPRLSCLKRVIVDAHGRMRKGNRLSMVAGGGIRLVGSGKRPYYSGHLAGY